MMLFDNDPLIKDISDIFPPQTPQRPSPPPKRRRRFLAVILIAVLIIVILLFNLLNGDDEVTPTPQVTSNLTLTPTVIQTEVLTETLTLSPSSTPTTVIQTPSLTAVINIPLPTLTPTLDSYNQLLLQYGARYCFGIHTSSTVPVYVEPQRTAEFENLDTNTKVLVIHQQLDAAGFEWLKIAYLSADNTLMLGWVEDNWLRPCPSPTPSGG